MLTGGRDRINAGPATFTTNPYVRQMARVGNGDRTSGQPLTRASPDSISCEYESRIRRISASIRTTVLSPDSQPADPGVVSRAAGDPFLWTKVSDGFREILQMDGRDERVRGRSEGRFDSSGSDGRGVRGANMTGSRGVCGVCLLCRSLFSFTRIACPQPAVGR